jgi:hypothetical protein
MNPAQGLQRLASRILSTSADRASIRCRRPLFLHCLWRCSPTVSPTDAPHDDGLPISRDTCLPPRPPAPSDVANGSPALCTPMCLALTRRAAARASVLPPLFLLFDSKHQRYERTVLVSLSKVCGEPYCAVDPFTFADKEWLSIHPSSSPLNLRPTLCFLVLDSLYHVGSNHRARLAKCHAPPSIARRRSFNASTMGNAACNRRRLRTRYQALVGCQHQDRDRHPRHRLFGRRICAQGPDA